MKHQIIKRTTETLQRVLGYFTVDCTRPSPDSTQEAREREILCRDCVYKGKMYPTTYPGEFRDFNIHGFTPELGEDMAERLVNPPVCIKELRDGEFINAPRTIEGDIIDPDRPYDREQHRYRDEREGD